jgi:predicted aspartyl protease
MGLFEHSVQVFDFAGSLIDSVDLWVDTASSYTWLPATVRDRLGLQPREQRTFMLANGIREQRPVAQVTISLGGPSFSTYCAFAEEADAPLLGVIALEEAGLAVDPVNQRLVPVDAFRF